MRLTTGRSFNNILKLVSCLFFFVAFNILMNSCGNSQNPSSWNNYVEGIGTGSSARAADLNNDGILDFVIGAGGKENNVTDTAVIAIDGANGKLLWKIPGINQMIGSAGFLDVTYDGIQDVFIGGRSAQLIAIDGSNGNILWTFSKVNPEVKGLFAFYNPQFVADQNNDGYKDILIANGGDNFVEAYNPKRPAGRLMVISSNDGKLIANAVVPDGKETYMSPVCNQNDQSNPVIYFGTGGETVGGNFYKNTLENLLKENLSGSIVLAQSKDKGFIAPPVLADINGDNTKDAIVNSVDGRLIAIDGITNSVIWQVDMQGAEAYSTPSVGFYNDDETPDFFCTYGLGIWPKIDQSIHFMVDGKSGSVKFKDLRSGFQYASPVTADLNADGMDEVIVSINEINHYGGYGGKFYSFLIAYNFKDNLKIALSDTLEGVNVASTPWIGDIDNNGHYDIFFNSIYFNNYKNDIHNPTGLRIALFKTKYKISTPLRWGAYMGTNYDGNF